MMKERYDYLDIARGLGILMVVWAHIMITGWTHKMIYAFHMPLFFFLSGMVFQKGKFHSFSQFFTHRAKRLLLPYVIYSVATWIFWAAFRYIRHDEVESYFMPLLQTFIAQGSGAFIVHNSALWFIPCLFLTEILYYFISKTGEIWCLAICFACAAASFLLGDSFGDKYWFTPPWNADAALIALPFYAVGNIMIRHISHKRLTEYASNRRVIISFAVVALAAILYWSSMFFDECSMGSSSYQCNSWVFMTRAFVGIAWLLIISLLLASVKGNTIAALPIRFFKWCGVKSLDIMCLHIPLKGVFMIVVAIGVHTTVESVGCDYLLSFTSFAMTMTAAWMIIWTIRRTSKTLKSIL